MFSQMRSYVLTYTVSEFCEESWLAVDQIATPILVFFFFSNDPAPPEISPLPLRDALPIYPPRRRAGSGAGAHADARAHPGRHRRPLPPPHRRRGGGRTPPAEPAGVGGVEPRPAGRADRKSTRLNSSHSQISYAVFCLHKKN